MSMTGTRKGDAGDGRRIGEAFSRASGGYDALASLQDRIGRAGLEILPSWSVGGRILDVGAGTGRLTACLRGRLPGREVIALDLAEGMTRLALRRLGGGVVRGDALGLPFVDGAFDGVFSNLAYQWVGDLAGAFKEIHRCLTPGGEVVLSLFGSGTLEELTQAFVLSGVPLSPRRLPSLRRVAADLKAAGFIHVEVREEREEETFTGLMELLAWLKGIGANTPLRRRPLTPRRLTAASDVYAKRWPSLGGIRASFVVIRARALRPGRGGGASRS